MNGAALFNSQFVQLTLPMMLTFIGVAWGAAWAIVTTSNKRLDDINRNMDRRFEEVNRRLDEIIQRLDKIDTKLEAHQDRITRLEEQQAIAQFGGGRRP